SKSLNQQSVSGAMSGICAHLGYLWLAWLMPTNGRTRIPPQITQTSHRLSPGLGTNPSVDYPFRRLVHCPHLCASGVSVVDLARVCIRTSGLKGAPTRGFLMIGIDPPPSLR